MTLDELSKKYEKAVDEILNVAAKVIKENQDDIVEFITEHPAHYEIEKMPVTKSGDTVTGGFFSTSEIDEFKEFGTGVIGREFESASPFQDGWHYDINEHGIGGWVYYKNGQFWRTNGMIGYYLFTDGAETFERETMVDLSLEIERILGG